ncbi:MAG: protein kinase [Acidobacteriota bacterium]
MSVLPEIDSRFDVLEKLGEGGMGCVYKVRHRDLDEIQIVKTLQAHLSANEGLRNRFINEARRGMRLRHPHIAGVHDFAVCADGTGYIVMEFVQGHNLRDILHARGPLPVSMVGQIAIQALDALSYLHSEKFVHRDISPDNLMMTTTPDGRLFVKLIDLGISKSMESGQTMTGTGQFLGKVSYASPEQFGGELDGRSDLYSLGVVLYNLLTNAFPFTGANNRELMTALLFKTPRTFAEAAPNVKIPEAVQRVVMRALEKDPNARYRDASEFCAAVEDAFAIHDVRTISTATRPARTMDGAQVPVGAGDPTQVDVTEAGTVDSTVGAMVGATGPFRPTLLTGGGGAPTMPGTTVAAKTAVNDRTEISIPTTPPAPDTVPHRGPIASPLSSRWLLITAVLAILVAAALVVLWQRKQAADLAGFGSFHAVVIGEGSYRKLESLPSAVPDARAVAELLRRDYGFEVTLLENAGKQQVLDAIRATGKKMTARDNLVVYYAGHGSIRNDLGYWQPVDADLEMGNWISPANIKDVLVDYPALRMLILADSCQSGALAKVAVANEDTSLKEKRARLVLSSGGDAPVLDSADGKHSLFTIALLEALANPSRGAVDVQTLFPRIQERVSDAAKRAGREQIPQLAVMAEVGDEGGSFFFVKR